MATPLFRVTTATPTHLRPQGNIFIDGVCGDQTIGFIEYFQEMMRLRGEAGAELNGQVAPLGTKATTTMKLLNYTPDKIGLPRTLGQSDAFPQELNNSFYNYV